MNMTAESIQRLTIDAIITADATINVCKPISEKA